jgi:hypothetical protein
MAKLEGDHRVLQPLVAGDVTRDPAKTIKVVAGIRRLMGEVARPNDPREYFWGLLLDTAFAAAWAPDDSEARWRALLLGGVICDRLEHWTNPWPLRERLLPPLAGEGGPRRPPRQLRLRV